MCQRGRTGAHYRAQSIRRQAGSPSAQFSPVIVCNFTPVLTNVSEVPATATHWLSIVVANGLVCAGSDRKLRRSAYCHVPGLTR